MVADLEKRAAAVVTPNDLDDVGVIVHAGGWSCPCGADVDDNLNFLDAEGMKKVTHLQCSQCGRLAPFWDATGIIANNGHLATENMKLRAALRLAGNTIERLTAPGGFPKFILDALAEPAPVSPEQRQEDAAVVSDILRRHMEPESTEGKP